MTSAEIYEDFIQTDAAIIRATRAGRSSPGRQGPASTPPSRAARRFQGIVLAVASNLARTFSALRTDGVVHRGYLGVQIRELQPEVPSLRPHKGAGVVIGEVFESTPPKRPSAAGDIITSIAGKAIKDGRSLQMTIANLPIKHRRTRDSARGPELNAGDARGATEGIRHCGRAGAAPPQSAARHQARQARRRGQSTHQGAGRGVGFRSRSAASPIANVTAARRGRRRLKKGMVISKIDSQRIENVDQAASAHQRQPPARRVAHGAIAHGRHQLRPPARRTIEPWRPD